MSGPVLLPALHINQSRPRQTRQSHLKSPYQLASPTSIPRVLSSRNGHCNDPECFIWSPLGVHDRWRAFDAFDPRDVEDYGYNLQYTSSFNDARKMKRVSELKARAKERLMPPSQPRATRRVSRPAPSGANAILLAPPRERILRTPSPAPSSGWADRENDHAMERTPCAPETPKTPIRPRLHLDLDFDLPRARTPLSATQTPTSTVGSPSPLSSPPVLFFRASSP